MKNCTTDRFFVDRQSLWAEIQIFTIVFISVTPYRFFGPPEFKKHLYYFKCKKCLGVTYYERNVHNTCISQENYSCLGQVKINVEKRRKIIGYFYFRRRASRASSRDNSYNKVPLNFRFTKGKAKGLSGQFLLILYIINGK